MKVVLVMFKGDERREFAMEGDTFRIGRRPESDLRIPTADVSRQHCEFVIEDDKLIVHDVGSSNGTFVNGKSVDEIELKAGDRVSVGPVIFTVQINGEPADVKPSDSWVPGGAKKSVKPAPAEPPTQILGDENEDTGDLIDLDDLELLDDD